MNLLRDEVLLFLIVPARESHLINFSGGMTGLEMAITKMMGGVTKKNSPTLPSQKSKLRRLKKRKYSRIAANTFLFLLLSQHPFISNDLIPMFLSCF